MIDILKEYYGIEIKEYKEYNDGILFFVNDTNYYLTKTFFDKIYVDKCYEFYLILKTRKIKIHDFVFNKNHELLSEEYVLLKLNDFIEQVTFNDVYLFSNIIVNEYKDYIDMLSFWYKKIDYLEKQVTELSKNRLVNYSFDYFVGISEQLLLYYKNNYIKQSDNIYLAHRALNSLDSIDFYNPLNIMGGDKYKDIISYIRLKSDWDLFLELLDKVNSNDKIYIFVRMCFPFRYFDLVSDIVLEGKSDEELAILLSKIKEYEDYLIEVEKVSGIHLFSWIKKE